MHEGGLRESEERLTGLHEMSKICDASLSPVHSFKEVSVEQVSAAVLISGVEIRNTKRGKDLDSQLSYQNAS